MENRKIQFRFFDSKEKVMSAPFDWYDLKLMPSGWEDREIMQFTGLFDKHYKGGDIDTYLSDLLT